MRRLRAKAHAGARGGAALLYGAHGSMLQQQRARAARAVRGAKARVRRAARVALRYDNARARARSESAQAKALR